MGINSDSGVYISMPAALDFSFARTSTGDTCFDMLIEESRINLCIPFLLNLVQYFLDSIPVEQIDEGLINEGYEGYDNEIVSSQNIQIKIYYYITKKKRNLYYKKHI